MLGAAKPRRTGTAGEYWYQVAHAGVWGGCTHSATHAGGTELVQTVLRVRLDGLGFDDTDPDTNPRNNGFRTAAYATDRRNAWSTVELDDALPGDAMVRYDTETKRGHIVLVAEARDDDHWIKTYECEGCSAGCWARRRLIRAADYSETDVDWHAIRRHGWPAR